MMKTLKAQKTSILSNLSKAKKIIFIFAILFSWTGAFAQYYSPEDYAQEGEIFDEADYESYYGFGVTPAREWLLARNYYDLWTLVAVDAVDKDPVLGIKAANLDVVRTGTIIGGLTVTERTNYNQWAEFEITVTLTAELYWGFTGYPIVGRAYRKSHTYYNLP